jgi:Xaa-Pro aminopeptidase
MDEGVLHSRLEGLCLFVCLPLPPSFAEVAQGHIGLAQAVFPEGVLGARLDTLARLSLWAAGLDYNHGTGHGIGGQSPLSSFSPYPPLQQLTSTSTRAPRASGPDGDTKTRSLILLSSRPSPSQGFVCGMTTSNEPGYYEDEAFGIRIESICITVRAGPGLSPASSSRFCRFETITLCPIQLSLLDRALLTPPEVAWLNNYHREVRERLSPLMAEKFPEAMDYLMSQTEVFV